MATGLRRLWFDVCWANDLMGLGVWQPVWGGCGRLIALIYYIFAIQKFINYSMWFLLCYSFHYKSFVWSHTEKSTTRTSRITKIISNCINILSFKLISKIAIKNSFYIFIYWIIEWVYSVTYLRLVKCVCSRIGGPIKFLKLPALILYITYILSIFCHE